MNGKTINWQFVLEDDSEEYYGSFMPESSWGVKSGYSIENMVFVRLSYHEDEATDSRATVDALKKFKSLISVPTGLRKMTVIEKKKRILFTSIQIEYTIELIADKKAVKEYYDNYLNRLDKGIK